METTADFPVNPGTVVEVQCTYPEAINEGSNEVTCISGKTYNFEKEPKCAIAGKKSFNLSLAKNSWGILIARQLLCYIRLRHN